jgi:hypothetical protein
VSPDKGKHRKGSRKPPAGPTPTKSPAKDPGPPYRVLWHPDAEAELRGLNDGSERAAVRHAAQKLEAEGPRLRFPHQSAVQGDEGKGLRELRPRAGRCVWRPLYRRVKPDTYVIGAVSPEAEVDQSGFNRAARDAQQRLNALELE